MKPNKAFVEFAAILAHEVNRAYCASIGDSSQPTWKDAPQWQKDSAMKGVEFLCDNPKAKPEDQHRAWCEVKVADGWSWGPVKDPTKKEHPCLIEYDRLPQSQRTKDYLFGAVVRTYFSLEGA